MEPVLFNVLTRVSRPGYFATCRESVQSQTYRHWRQVVSIDSEECVLCVAGLPSVRLERMQPGAETSFPYNLYFNRLYSLVEGGWVLFLDDDDMLASPWSLADLAERIAEDGADPDVLYLWKVWFPSWNSVVPRRSFGQAPTECDINSSGVCFHSKHIPHATWDGNKIGDFRVISRLYHSIPRTVWIDRVLTAQQEDQHLGSLADRAQPARRPSDDLGRMAALLAERDRAAEIAAGQMRQALEAQAAANEDLQKSRAEQAAVAEALQQSRAQMAASAEALQQSRSELAATAQALQQSQAQLSATDQALQQSQAQLSATDQALQQSQAQSSATDQALQQSRAELASCTQALQQSRAEAAAAGRALEQARHEADTAAEALRQAQEETTTLLSSRSWRWTRRARVVAGELRRLKALVQD